MIFGNKLQNDWILKATQLFPKHLSTTLIIAPHPDDESLGCGGVIALLRNLNIKVHVCFISDGSMSHPNSKKFPADILMLQREKEAKDALNILGINSNENCTFFRLRDAKVPTVNDDGFKDAVIKMSLLIDNLKPETIFVPWQKDPHKDHRASWNIVDSALKKINYKPRVLQYFIWLWELGKDNDLPNQNKINWYKINIEEVIDLKQQAIKAHISQTTNLIDDDPEGFTLSPQVLSHFKSNYELFAEGV